MAKSQEEVEEAIEKFVNKLNEMTSQLGRGGAKSGTPSKPAAQVPESAMSKRQEREHNALVAEANKREKAKIPLMDEHKKALKKEVDLRKDLNKATKKVENETGKHYENLKRSGPAFQRFGKSLISGSVDLQSAMGSLGDSLSYTGGVMGKFAAGVLGGAGYILGGMQEFAKNAAEMGAFADLGTFRVGSVTQMKILSGLGNSFIKVIEGSKGGFRAFGADSEEAAKNLSNLSRGLKFGSSHLNTTMKKTLGKDFIASVDRASNAAAAMGLSDEARADLMGSLAQSSTLGALNEIDAQQRLADQYDKTLDSTRKLSNAFGISATAILKAMEEFRGTSAGQAAALTGDDQGAKNLVGLIKEMGIESDPEKAAKIAVGISSGNYGLAQANVSNPAAIQLLEKLNQAAAGSDGGKNIDLVNKNLKSEKGWFENFSKERIGENFQGLHNQQWSDPGIKAGVFAKRMSEGDKDVGKKPLPTSEATNIKAMNTLEAALGSLRSAILGLTITLITTLGTLGALLAGGAIGGLVSKAIGGSLGALGSKIGDMFSKASTPGKGIMGSIADKVKDMFGKKPEIMGPPKPPIEAGKGIMGSITDKVKDMFGKKPEIMGPPKPPGLKTGGIVDKISGAASKGMGAIGSFLEQIGSSGAVKGAATLALLGGALMLAGKGFKEFNDVNWESVVKGTVALGGLVVITKIMSAASTSMLKGALAIGVLGAAMWVAGKGFKEFNDVNWDSLAKGVVALAVLGVAVTALGVVAPTMFIGSIAIGVLGAALGIFAMGIKQFNDVEWGSLAKGVVALAGLGIAVALISPALATMLIAAIPLIAFGAALGIFAMGIKQFSEVEWDSIPKGLAAITALAFGVLLITPALAIMAIASIPLLLFGAALGIFAMGIKQFNDVEWGSLGVGIIALGAFGLAVAGLALLLPGILLGSIVMTVLAVSVAVLGIALIPAAAAAKMFAEALETVSKIDGSNLIKIGAGLGAIGLGMISFAAGMIVGTASSVLTGIMSLFGAKSPLDKIMEFVPYADAISSVGTSIKNFGEGVLAVQQGTASIDTDILDNLKNKLLEFAVAGSSDEMKLTAQYLAQIGSSLTEIGSISTISIPKIDAMSTPADMTANLGTNTNATGPIGNMLNNSTITPEVVAQLMSYLSSIENDLSAIRGNTKSTGNEAPVRLA